MEDKRALIASALNIKAASVTVQVKAALVVVTS